MRRHARSASRHEISSLDEDLASTFYRCCYSQVFLGGVLTGRSYRSSHRLVERGIVNDGLRILEIGAGQGEHLDFVRGDFESYVMLDKSAPRTPDASENDPRLSWVVESAESASFAPESFDRIVSMCVLHHVEDVASVLRNIRTWLAPGGTFTLFLPSDPGVLNRFVRRLVVIPRARKLGFPQYALVNAREHRNHYWAIRTELEYQFESFDISRRYFPLPIPLGNLSLFSIWRITKPRDV